MDEVGSSPATDINQLDERTVHRIAAGEVVERPASVVKELVENSVDAEADRIDIEVSGELGTERIVVEDDGRGIPTGQLPVALQAHTTSKIADHSDLEAGPVTLGFRGEALHAIAEVATVTIASRSADDDVGRELIVDGGERLEDRSLGLPIGTRIVVEDLFEHVPARRKFLDSAATERDHIRRTVADLALANPDIAMRLVFNERELLATPGDGDAKAAIAAVHGRSVADELYTIDVPDELPPGVTAIEGYLGDPETTRASSTGMTTVVNGRPVRSGDLRRPIIAGYGDRLGPNRYPIAIVRVGIDPALVDVNVHPRKNEVQFEPDAAVEEAIHTAVASTIEAHAGPPTGPPREGRSHRRGEKGPRPAIDLGAISVGGTQATLPGANDESHEDRFERLPALAVIGQAHDAYIVAESGDGGIVLIDQHAADERINYERLREEVRRSLDRQRLATPVSIELSDEELDATSTFGNELGSMGFDIDHTGDNIVTISSVPSVLGRSLESSHLRAAIHDLLTGFLDADGTETVLQLADPLLADLACHPAIKASESLTEGSMESLLTALDTCSSPWTCPHGRPTMIELTGDELAERFERDYPGARPCRDWDAV